MIESKTSAKSLNKTEDIVDISQLINPFPGLRPFGIEESHLFFGREGQSDEVLSKLSENKFIAILGASGSGKSSLMFCGLIPTLYGGFMTEAGSKWRIVVARPGGGPIDNLAEALLLKDKEYTGLSHEDKLIRKTIISTVLRSSSLGLVEVVQQLQVDNNENILILVDQFEELFRYKKIEAASSDLDESSAFVNLILEAIHQSEAPIYIALTMRSDFIGECAQFPSLTQVINDSHYLIPQMTRDQKRIAIEGPIAVGGGKIAPRLTQQLLNDVGDNPDQLPILQHALMRSWSYWTENRKVGEPLDLRHYNAIGRLKEALSQHANEAYDSLNRREKGISEVMFKALTESAAENYGIRRPTQLSTIAAIAGVAEDEVVQVVDRFREPGRSLLMPPHGVPLYSDTVIDISHESLMRIWVRLKTWLDEEAKSAEMYLKLSEASQRYQEGRAGLWNMPDLQLALNWRQQNQPTLVWGQRYNPAFERTMVFLETSERAYLTTQRNNEILQKKKVKFMRLTAIVLSIATLITLCLVIYSFIKADQADKAREDAESAAELAILNEQKAIQQEKIAEQKAEEAIKANAAAEEAKEDALRNLELAQQQEALAKEKEEQANEARKDAEVAKEAAEQSARKAIEAEKVASEQRDIAQGETERADRLRFQAIAQSMAVKAENIVTDKDEDQAELKGIVAKQAFSFYQEYKEEGKDYNGDIYAGVYSALQALYQVHTDIHNPERGDSALNKYIVPLDPLNEEKTNAVKSVAYTKDGKKMYSANASGEVILWDISTRKHQVVYQNKDVARVVNISPDEKYLALGTEESYILLFNIKALDQEPIQIKGHEGGTIFDLVFLPNSRGFISVGKDQRLLQSDFSSSREIARSEVRINEIDISLDARKIVGGGQDGSVYIWDMDAPNAEPSTLLDTKDSSPVKSVKISPDGRYLAYGNENGKVVIWDLQESTQIQPELTGFRAPVTDIEFSPDNRLVLATSTNRQVRIWDMENLFDLPIVLSDYKGLQPGAGWVYDADFSPDGKYFVTAAGDGAIRKYPTDINEMADQICENIASGKANMSDNEWRQYVGEGINYETTCEGQRKRQ